jgi:Double zinc ribbon
VTDVERLFRQLVANLGATQPARLRQPLLLADIRRTIVPYRANRRALQMESSEDYEVALMRLCAGEGGFARTGPDEVHDEFKREIGSPNPDLTLVEQRESAVVHLDPDAVMRIMSSNPELAYAPPAKDRAAEPPAVAPSSPAPKKAASHCHRCGSALPVGRVINFCPHCGQSLARRHCPQCNTELEPDWKHCVSCGATLHHS